MPFACGCGPVSRQERVGEHSAVVCHCVYRTPGAGDPVDVRRLDRAAVASHRREADVVEHDVDHVRRPVRRLGGSNGDQSGTESRMSTLILPWNGLLMTCSLRSRGKCPRCRRTGHRPERVIQCARALPAQPSSIATLIGRRAARFAERSSRFRAARRRRVPGCCYCLIATATPRELPPIARARRAYAPDATAPGRVGLPLVVRGRRLIIAVEDESLTREGGARPRFWHGSSEGKCSEPGSAAGLVTVGDGDHPRGRSVRRARGG